MFTCLNLSQISFLKRDHILSLLKDEIACIIIDDFYPHIACNRLVEFLQTHPYQFKKYSNIDAKVLGNPLYWANNSLTQYLDNSKSSQEKLNYITNILNIENPVELV